MRSVRIWLAVVVVCAVALTGCLKNPVTGRIGPSWDVPVEVPLISGKVTVNELASEYLKEYLPEEYDLEQPLVLEISKAVRLEPDELGDALDLPLDGFEVEVEIDSADLIDEVTSLDLPLGEISVEVEDIKDEFEVPVVPGEGLSHTKEMDLGFSKAVLSQGTLEVSIANKSGGNIAGLTITFTGLPGTDPLKTNLEAGNYYRATRDLEGEIDGTLQVELEADSIAGALEESPLEESPLEITISFTDMTATHVEDLEVDGELDFEFEVMVDSLDFDEVTFSAGTLTPRIDLTEVGTVQLNSAEIDGQGILGADGLAGITLVNGETKIVIKGSIRPEDGTITTLPSGDRQVEADLAGVKVKRVRKVGGFDPIELTYAVADWIWDFDFISLTFSGGELHFAFDGLDKGAVSVTALRVGETDLEGEHNSFFLGDLVLVRDDEAKLTVEIAGEELEFAGDTIQAVVDFVDISIVEARLVINPQDIAAADLSIDPVELDLDYGDYGEILDWLSGVDLAVRVTLDNPSGIPVDFGGLVLTVAGKTEDYEIKLEDAEKSVEGTVTTYTITSAAWLEMLRSEPQQITLGGTLKVGSEEELTVDPNAVVEIAVHVVINAVLTIDYDQESADLIIGSREVTQQADLDKGLEFISQPFLFAEVKNGIPVGVEAWLDLSTDPDNWDDAITKYLGEISAAKTDSEGRAVEAESALLELDVDDDVVDFLKQGGSVRVRIALSSKEGAGVEKIAITPSDAVEYKVWAEIRVKINQ